MAHSFVQSFDCEYDAFLAYAKTYPDSCTVLLDTYNTLKSGLVNAIRVAKEYLEPNGYRLQGVRIDSGGYGVFIQENPHGTGCGRNGGL